MKIQNILLSDLTLDNKSGLARALATVMLVHGDGRKIDLISFHVQQHFQKDVNIQWFKRRLIDDAERWVGLMNFVEIKPVLAAA